MNKQQALGSALLVAILLTILAMALAVLGIWVDGRWGLTALIPFGVAGFIFLAIAVTA